MRLPLRRAGAADAAAVRALTRSVYGKWVPLIGREPLPMAADFDSAVAKHWIDLVEVDRELIALIEMIPQADHLLVENIAVAESHQRKGIARQLLEHAVWLARASGLPELRLYTNKAFAANLAVYERLGFERFAEVPYPGGGSVIHFRKAVS
jgi:GNAT superfamily N-acetyltransferase